MKLNDYEIVLNSDGKTVKISTIDEEYETCVLEATGVVKKIKTNAEQVKKATEEFKKEKVLASTPIVTEEVVESTPIVEEEQVVEEPKTDIIPEVIDEIVETTEEIIDEPITKIDEKQVEEINDVSSDSISPEEPKEDIEEETKEIELEEVKPIELPKHKYSFENDVDVEEVKEDTSSAAKEEQTAYKNDSRLNYDKLYSKLDPYENLKNDLETVDANTIAGKVLRVGMNKLSKYDGLITEKDEELKELEDQKKEIEKQIEDKKIEKKELEHSKEVDVNVLDNAVKQAKQIDAYDKAQSELIEKQEKDEAERKAKAEKERQASIEKRREMFAHIPAELTEEEPKTPVKRNEDVIDISNIFNRFRTLEEEIPEVEHKKAL